MYLKNSLNKLNNIWLIREGEKLYFVAETKGTENVNDLKGTEKKKIFCGTKHFEVIDTGIKYEVVKELKSLKDRSWKMNSIYFWLEVL